jgi:hypothetical protein
MDVQLKYLSVHFYLSVYILSSEFYSFFTLIFFLKCINIQLYIYYVFIWRLKSQNLNLSFRHFAE